MFPMPSGWFLPETTLRFFTYTGKSRSSLTSARFNVITIALSTPLPTLSRVTYTPCFRFPLFVSLFLFGMTVPEPIEFRQLDTFPHLCNCTPKFPRSLHPASPLLVMWQLTPGCFCAFNCCIQFALCLSYCFAVFCVCCFVLTRIPCFFACQFSRNYPRQFFRGVPFSYSWFTFSHYELPSPTRDRPYVRSGLYQLVICVKEIRGCAVYCVREVTSFRIAFEVFGVDTTLSMSPVLYR